MIWGGVGVGVMVHDALVRSSFRMCFHCGLCADACVSGDVFWKRNTYEDEHDT